MRWIYFTPFVLREYTRIKRTKWNYYGTKPNNRWENHPNVTDYRELM